MYWNLGQLAQSLSLICEDTELLSALEAYAAAYRKALRKHVFRRLAITPKDMEADLAFVLQTFRYLENSQCSWPQFWYDWQGGAGQLMRAKKSLNSEFYAGQEFADWLTAFGVYEAAGAPVTTEKPASLIYEEIGALWKPIDEADDWSLFEAKLASFDQS